MKSIQTRALVLLLVITMSLCASLNLNREEKSKTTRKSKTASKTAAKAKTGTKTTFNGSGTWTSGYDCPYIEVLTFNSGSSSITSTTQAYKFFPDKLNSNYGFKFIMDGGMDSTLNQFVKTTPTGEKYIPWRYFDTVAYEKKTASFKMIVANLRNDEKKTNVLRFNLPWEFFGSPVSVDQANKLVDIFQNFSTYQKNSINKSKTNANTLFGKMSKAKTAMDASQMDAAA